MARVGTIKSQSENIGSHSIYNNGIKLGQQNHHIGIKLKQLSQFGENIGTMKSQDWEKIGT